MGMVEFCPRCGSSDIQQNPRNENYCGSCGKVIPHYAEPRRETSGDRTPNQSEPSPRQRRDDADLDTFHCDVCDGEFPVAVTARRKCQKCRKTLCPRCAAWENPDHEPKPGPIKCSDCGDIPVTGCLRVFVVLVLVLIALVIGATFTCR